MGAKATPYSTPTATQLCNTVYIAANKLVVPLPPNICISICSRRYCPNVFTWGSSPNVNISGKQSIKTVTGKQNYITGINVEQITKWNLMQQSWNVIIAKIV